MFSGVGCHGAAGAATLWLNTHQASSAHAQEIQDVAGQLKLTWLVLGEDPAARSHRVEQFTAL